jgi:hypothetical protein
MDKIHVHGLVKKVTFEQWFFGMPIENKFVSFGY